MSSTAENLSSSTATTATQQGSPDDPWELIDTLGARAGAAARRLATADEDTKNRALTAAATELKRREAELLRANALDIAFAREKGRPDAFIDRLRLNSDRIAAMAGALEDIAALPDPVGRRLATFDRPNGLNIQRVATPIGVIGMVFESRPNVAADAGALCVKSGNAVILRGGSEGRHSVRVIVEALQAGFAEAGMPRDSVQAVDTADREAVTALLQCTDHIDLVIPRGGHGLVSLVSREARVPTLLHLDGNCHSYVHSAADIDKAIAVVRNAKLRRTGICGATESLVVDEQIAGAFLPKLLEAMPDCKFVGDEKARAIAPAMGAASDDDWGREYLDATLSVKVVDGIEAAMTFISRHSSGHTDAIVTEDGDAAEAFLAGIDSAVVMHNASTQFSDGGEFGMGAEIGIATGKMHARGPVGLEQLTSFKYQVRGNGQTRS